MHTPKRDGQEILTDLARHIKELDEVARVSAKGALTELARDFVAIREFYENLEKVSTALSLLKSRMAYEDVPKAFERDKITTLTLKDGYRVTISSLVRASTKDMQEGIKWFKRCTCGHSHEAHQDGNCTVQVQSTKKRLVDCDCDGYNAPNAPLVKETINASTLAAFAKAEMEEGRELPDDIFNIFVGSNTSVTKVGK